MSDVSKAEYYRVMAGLAIKADNRYKEEGLEENKTRSRSASRNSRLDSWRIKPPRWPRAICF